MEVLDMARIENGKISLNEEEFNLSDLVDNIVTISRPGIEKHGHRLDMHISKITHEKVRGDQPAPPAAPHERHVERHQVHAGRRISYSIREIPDRSQRGRVL